KQRKQKPARSKPARSKPPRSRPQQPTATTTPMVWGETPPMPEAPAQDSARTPVVPAESAPGEPRVSTGPSGLLLGAGTHGPVSIRLFRRTPTRLALAVPDYVTWLLAYRCISLGAHLSIYAQEPRRWTGLVDAVGAGGGSADLL